MERFFAILSRINGILLLIVLLSVLGLLTYTIGIDWFRGNDRGVVAAPAASSPAAEKAPVLTLSRATAVSRGGVLMLALEEKGEGGYGKFSGSGGPDRTRNFVFLVGPELKPHWLFDSSNKLILHHEFLNQECCNQQETSGASILFVRYVSEDTNKDGRLSDEDTLRFALVRPDREEGTLLLNDVDQTLSEDRINTKEVSIVYTRKDSTRVMVVDVDNLKVRSDREIMKGTTPTPRGSARM